MLSVSHSAPKGAWIKIAILNYKHRAPNGASEMTVFQNLKPEK